MSKGLWGIPKRVKDLRVKHLPERGAYWRGTEEEFVEFLIQTVQQMPKGVSGVMHRYYVAGETQQMNPDTGRAESTDSNYYMILGRGRDILATMIRTANYDKRPLDLLERVYG